MIKTVFGNTRAELSHEIGKMRALMISAAAFTLVLNIALVLLRNDSNHTAMSVINIVTDILAGCFLLFFYDMKYLPKRSVEKLMLPSLERAEIEVIEINEDTEKHRGIDVRRVVTSEDIYYLPYGAAVKLETGGRVAVYTLSSVILEVEEL